MPGVTDFSDYAGSQEEIRTCRLQERLRRQSSPKGWRDDEGFADEGDCWSVLTDEEACKEMYKKIKKK